jgi:hypothetical protein
MTIQGSCGFQSDAFQNDTFQMCIDVLVVTTEESRRWPGPSKVIYRETDVIPTWQRQREDEEIIIL